jgi:hypothetical protein
MGGEVPMTLLDQVYELLADGRLWSRGDLMRAIPGTVYDDIEQALRYDRGVHIRKLEVAHPVFEGPKFYYKKRG